MPDTEPDTVSALLAIVSAPRDPRLYGPTYFHGGMTPRPEDEADFDPREDHDPFGHEADLAAAREYGRG